MGSVKQNFIQGFFWSVIGHFGYLAVVLITNIIFARILTPFEFGEIGIIMFFIVIANVLTESGLSGAIVRKIDCTDDDINTVFTFNLFLSFIIGIVYLFIANPIAAYYEDPLLSNLLVASTAILLINALQITHIALLVKEMDFRKKAVFDFIAVVISSAVGVVLAYLGFGVWSFIIMQLLNAFIVMILLFSFSTHKNRLTFNRQSFKTLYKFGVNTTLASILTTAYDNIYQLLLGKHFSIVQTGLFYQAKKLQEVPVGIIKSTALGVVFSYLSSFQNDIAEFKRIYLRISSVFTVVVGFICVVIFTNAEIIIQIFYGEKWIEAAFYMKILIVASYFFMQEMFNRVIFKVFDQTDKILYLEIFKKVIQTFTIVAGILTMDLKILLYGLIVVSVFSYFLNSFYASRIINKKKFHEIDFNIRIILIGGLVAYLHYLFKNMLDFTVLNQVLLLFPSVLLYFILLLAATRINILKEGIFILKNFKSKRI